MAWNICRSTKAQHFQFFLRLMSTRKNEANFHEIGKKPRNRKDVAPPMACKFIQLHCLEDEELRFKFEFNLVRESAEQHHMKYTLHKERGGIYIFTSFFRRTRKTFHRIFHENLMKYFFVWHWQWKCAVEKIAFAF